MSFSLDLIKSVTQLSLMARPGWNESIRADLDLAINRERANIPLWSRRKVHSSNLDGASPDSGSEPVNLFPNEESRYAYGSLRRRLARRPFEPTPLTYAEMQGQLCAEEAFFDATDRLHERVGPLTYDDYLAAWGDVVELLIVKAEVAPEMSIFTAAERMHWLSEAVGTVIDKARIRFLVSIRHIEERGHFAPGMHECVGIMRDFLISRDVREAYSFDDLIAARNYC